MISVLCFLLVSVFGCFSAIMVTCCCALLIVVACIGLRNLPFCLWVTVLGGVGIIYGCLLLVLVVAVLGGWWLGFVRLAVDALCGRCLGCW